MSSSNAVKRIEVVQEDGGSFKYVVRHDNTEKVLSEDGGYESVSDAIKAAEDADLGNRYYAVPKQAQKPAETVQQVEKTDDGPEDQPTSFIETVG